MSHLFLPALDEKANFNRPNARALWSDAQRKVMAEIAKGITADPKKDINSIPDVWARPLLCREALRETTHPKHKDVLKEWQGLLSLLALHKVRGFDLKFVSLEFAAENQQSFLNSLHRLSPSAVQLQRDVSYAWNHLLLIQLGDIPLGAFSPATLVFTGADYFRTLKERADFDLKDDQGRLCPPSDPADRMKVGEWLQWFIDKNENIFWGGEENPDQKLVADICGLLGQWLKEIRTEFKVPDGQHADSLEVEVDQSPVSVVGQPQWLQQYQVYQSLLTPLREAEVAGVRLSEYALAPERNRKSAGEVVLITEDLLKENRRIWRTTTLTVLGGDAAKVISSNFSAPSGTTIGTRSDFGDAGIWVRPELYFLVDAVLASKEGFLDESVGAVNKGTKYLLPFSRAILDFFSPKTIINTLTPEWSAPHQDGSVEFSFTLPLHGNRTIRVSRRYRRQNPQPGEGLLRDVAVPLVTIYPRYIDDRWRQHYLFQTDAAEFRVEPLLDARAVSIDERHLGAEKPVRIISMLGKGAYPEAIEFSSLRGDAASPVGIALLPPPTGSVVTPAGEWEFGIDFGTSNTNVYYKVDDQSQAMPFAFEFEALQLRITAAKDDERLRMQRAFFVSDRKIDLPIPTVIRIFDPGRPAKKLFLDFSIAVPEAYELKPWEYSNIKWDVMGERKTDLFLEDLMFIILVKLAVSRAEKATFYFSYPEAFPEFFAGLFKNECIKVFQKLVRTEESRVIDPGGLTINDLVVDRSDEEKCSFKVEGQAGGEYFASKFTGIPAIQQANIDTQAVCLDIGGGTSDISIWFNQQIRNEASVLLAGRQIAEVFRASSQLCQRLLPSPACATLEPFRGTPDKFSATLNLILRDPDVEKTIGPNLLKYATDRSVIWLRKMLALEFGAIVYYAGKLIAATDRLAGGEGIMRKVDRKGINFHWGGNAAKLIFWLDYGMKGIDKNGSARALFGAILFNSLCDAFEEMGFQPTMEDDGALNHFSSPIHKSEVSAGQVVMGLRKRDNEATGRTKSDMRQRAGTSVQSTRSQVKAVVSGESITLLDNTEIKSTDALRDEDLFNEGRTNFDGTSLRSLDAFLALYNRFCVETGIFPDKDVIKLDKNQKRYIEDGIESWFKQTAKELDKNKRKLQPVFIVEITHLFKLLQDEMGR